MSEGSESDRVRHDYAARSDALTSTRVVECVATATGVDPFDMPPLYDTVDPDALDDLVSSSSRCRLSFRFAGTDVEISETGDIHVPPADD